MRGMPFRHWRLKRDPTIPELDYNGVQDWRYNGSRIHEMDLNVALAEARGGHLRYRSVREARVLADWLDSCEAETEPTVPELE